MAVDVDPHPPIKLAVRRQFPRFRLRHVPESRICFWPLSAVGIRIIPFWMILRARKNYAKHAELFPLVLTCFWRIELMERRPCWLIISCTKTMLDMFTVKCFLQCILNFHLPNCRPTLIVYAIAFNKQKSSGSYQYLNKFWISFLNRMLHYMSY